MRMLNWGSVQQLNTCLGVLQTGRGGALVSLVVDRGMHPLVLFIGAY